jgi:hypothetical protein
MFFLDLLALYSLSPKNNVILSFEFCPTKNTKVGNMIGWQAYDGTHLYRCIPDVRLSVHISYDWLCLVPQKKYYKKRFTVTLNLRYMYGVLNVYEIKN